MSEPILLPGDSAIVALGGDTIIVRRARLTMKSVVLVPAASGECEPEEEDEAQCVELRRDPVTMDLPLAGSAATVFTARAPADSYAETHVGIGPKAGRGPAIQLEGVWSRTGVKRGFVYVAALDEIEELELAPALLLQAQGAAQLTLRLDLATWFLTANRAALVDPGSANPGGPNEILVRDNIRMSIRASP